MTNTNLEIKDNENQNKNFIDYIDYKYKEKIINEQFSNLSNGLQNEIDKFRNETNDIIYNLNTKYPRKHTISELLWYEIKDIFHDDILQEKIRNYSDKIHNDININNDEIKDTDNYILDINGIVNKLHNIFLKVQHEIYQQGFLKPDEPADVLWKQKLYNCIISFVLYIVPLSIVILELIYDNRPLGLLIYEIIILFFGTVYESVIKLFGKADGKWVTKTNKIHKFLYRYGFILTDDKYNYKDTTIYQYKFPLPPNPKINDENV